MNSFIFISVKIMFVLYQRHMQCIIIGLWLFDLIVVQQELTFTYLFKKKSITVNYHSKIGAGVVYDSMAREFTIANCSYRLMFIVFVVVFVDCNLSFFFMFSYLHNLCLSLVFLVHGLLIFIQQFFPTF